MQNSSTSLAIREGNSRKLIMIRKCSWSSHAIVWDWVMDSWVMGHLGHGSAEWWVTWVMGHKM